jgi:CO dehydrogenase/acetyl-CoA synthase delta subunit
MRIKTGIGVPVQGCSCGGGDTASVFTELTLMKDSCGSGAPEPPLPPWATDTVATAAGPVYRISTRWSRADYWGMIKSRTSAFRMHYTVAPGLYVVGEPTPEANVLVTANYKLSFDTLRRELAGLNAWILVLDTQGINVWCAAGKGTFGTAELIRRLAATQLEAVVSHRRLILPQLGAVGVSASEIKKQTGFTVSFGPVRARDLPAYIGAGYQKTEEMRTIEFPLLDRLILTPMEINPALKKFPWLAGIILLLFGLQPTGLLFAPAWHHGLPFLLLALLAVLSGALLTPVLLPWVPGRSFALKGWFVGLLALWGATRLFGLLDPPDALLTALAYLFFPALGSYLALQFTGATTFTGMSGVKKELKIGLPLYLAAAGLSLVFMILFKIREWGLL